MRDRVINACYKAVKYAKSTFETNLARNIQHNPNLFWKYVRSNTKVRDDVDKLVKRDGTLTCSDRGCVYFSDRAKRTGSNLIS